MYIKVFCARIVYKGNRKTGTGYKYKTVLLEGLRKFSFIGILENILYAIVTFS